MTTDDGDAAVPAIRTYRPPLFRTSAASMAGTQVSRTPMSAHDALVMTAVGLREPDRWRKHVMFEPESGHRPIDPDADPFAGRWYCCALGMLWVVTIGMEWAARYGQWLTAWPRSNPSGGRLFREANDALRAVMVDDDRYDGYQTVAAFNDDPTTSHEDVLRLVDSTVIATAPSEIEEEETTTE